MLRKGMKSLYAQCWRAGMRSGRKDRREEDCVGSACRCRTNFGLVMRGRKVQSPTCVMAVSIGAIRTPITLPGKDSEMSQFASELCQCFETFAPRRGIQVIMPEYEARAARQAAQPGLQPHIVSGIG